MKSNDELRDDDTVSDAERDFVLRLVDFHDVASEDLEWARRTRSPANDDPLRDLDADQIQRVGRNASELITKVDRLLTTLDRGGLSWTAIEEAVLVGIALGIRQSDDGYHRLRKARASLMASESLRIRTESELEAAKPALEQVAKVSGGLKKAADTIATRNRLPDDELLALWRSESTKLSKRERFRRIAEKLDGTPKQVAESTIRNRLKALDEI